MYCEMGNELIYNSRSLLRKEKGGHGKEIDQPLLNESSMEQFGGHLSTQFGEGVDVKVVVRQNTGGERGMTEYSVLLRAGWGESYVNEMFET